MAVQKLHKAATGKKLSPKKIPPKKKRLTKSVEDSILKTISLVIKEHLVPSPKTSTTKAKKDKATLAAKKVVLAKTEIPELKKKKTNLKKETTTAKLPSALKKPKQLAQKSGAPVKKVVKKKEGKVKVVNKQTKKKVAKVVKPKETKPKKKKPTIAASKVSVKMSFVPAKEKMKIEELRMSTDDDIPLDLLRNVKVKKDPEETGGVEKKKQQKLKGVKKVQEQRKKMILKKRMLTESKRLKQEAHSEIKKMKSFWNGPKRHRVASLNALAKVHCLYENETRAAFDESKPGSPKSETTEVLEPVSKLLIFKLNENRFKQE